MLERILPHVIDDTYRGQTLALWLFGAVLLVKCGIALAAIFDGRGAAQSADGIPLDRFGADAAAVVVTLFALCGLAQLVVGVFGVLALARYRALIPLMFVLFLLEHVARRVILFVKPVVRSGTPPSPWIHLALLGMLLVGLTLSLRGRAA